MAQRKGPVLRESEDFTYELIILGESLRVTETHLPRLKQCWAPVLYGTVEGLTWYDLVVKSPADWTANPSSVAF